MRLALAVRFLLPISLLLAACDLPATNPTVQVPVEPVPSCSPAAPRTVRITQAAPADVGVRDVFVTFLAFQVDPDTCEESPVKVSTQDPRAAAFIQDDRCFDVGDVAASCELGDLEPGQFARTITLDLDTGVRVSCLSSVFVGGSIGDYRPAPCVRGR